MKHALIFAGVVAGTAVLFVSLPEAIQDTWLFWGPGLGIIAYWFLLKRNKLI